MEEMLVVAKHYHIYINAPEQIWLRAWCDLILKYSLV